METLLKVLDEIASAVDLTNFGLCAHSRRFTLSAIDTLECQICKHSSDIQSLILKLPCSASMCLAEYYHGFLCRVEQAQNFLSTLVCKVPVEMLEDQFTVVTLRYEDLKSLMRIFAVTTGMFFSATYSENTENVVRESVENLIHETSKGENRQALDDFERLLMSSLTSQTSKSKNDTLLPIISQLLSHLKAQISGNALDPVLLLRRAIFPFVRVFGHNLEKSQSLDFQSCAIPRIGFDWLVLFQKKLNFIRLSFGDMDYRLDFVIALLFLLPLLLHQDSHDGPIQLESQYTASLVNSKVSFADRVNDLSAANSQLVSMKLLSFVGYQLYRFALGFRDRFILASPFTQILKTAADRFVGLKRNPSHDSTYIFLKRNLNQQGNEPDEQQLVTCAKLQRLVAPKWRSIIQSELAKLSSSQTEETVVEQIMDAFFPFVLFLGRSDLPDGSPELVQKYYSFNFQYKTFMKFGFNGSGDRAPKLLKQIRRCATTLRALLTHVQLKCSNSGASCGNPLTSAVIANDEVLSSSLAQMISDLSIFFSELHRPGSESKSD
ncbi:hypothetical protein HDE_00890 [Halotydeus destructor]|nr:hypothetical protein HDE_00890 [Halotydeus destructor]